MRLDSGNTGTEEEEGSLKGAELYRSAWAAFAAARAGLGQPVPDFDELEDEFIIPFKIAVCTARDYAFESETAENPSFRAAAALTAASFLDASGIGEASPTDLIAFEAVARHVVNVLAYNPEDHGSLDDHESSWAEWAATQAQKRSGV